MSRAAITGTFPRLKRTVFLMTSVETTQYNCIAWAANDTSRWWWPTGYGYWPPGVRKAVDVDAFKAAYATLGYTECEDGSVEKRLEKIAIFANASGAVTHAARQLPSGTWTSKLGDWEDISHTIYGLEGSTYGSVACYMARPRTS